MKKYRLFNYNLEVFRNLYQYETLKDKKILEIGGCNLPRELLFNVFQAKQWICVDNFDWWGTGAPMFNWGDNDAQKPAFHMLEDAKEEHFLNPHLIFNGSACNIPGVFHNRFDAIVSSCAFEHINNLEQVIENIYQCLKPGGFFYSQFGPVWSGVNGSHFWVSEKLNFNTAQDFKIGPYDHLLDTPNSFREKMKNTFSSETLNHLIHAIYHDNHINRLFFDEYDAIMKLSKFKNYRCILQNPSTNKRLSQKLTYLYPQNQNWGGTTIEIHARKEP